MKFKKFLTIVDRKKIESIEEPIPVFGIDLYCKNEEEAKKVSSFFNYPTTLEVCVVVETVGDGDFDFSSN